MELNLKTFPIDVILVARDFVISKYGFVIDIDYEGNMATLKFYSKESEDLYKKTLSDFLLRYEISNKYRAIKEIIVGRALYGIVDELN